MSVSLTTAEARGASATLPLGWFTPDWQLPSGVRAACSTRSGGPPGGEGASKGPFGHFNLGDHVGDDPRAVNANRAAVRAALGAQPVFMRQVHGAEVARLQGGESQPEADACITTQAGVACTIMVADCLPVLLAHESGQVIGAAHAGWRGLAAGVIEATVARMRAEAGDPHLSAWLGPCIGPTAFEVGAEVKQAFEASDPGSVAHFTPAPGAGKWFADLAGLARRRLVAAGITRIAGNDGSAAWCTVNNPSRFFSYRRERVGGRFAAFIWRS